MFTVGDQVVAVLTASPQGCSFIIYFLEPGLAAQSGAGLWVVTAVEDSHPALRTWGHFKAHGYLHLLDKDSPFSLFGPSLMGADPTKATTTYIQAVMERDKGISKGLLCAHSLHTGLQTPHKCLHMGFKALLPNL